MFSCLVFFPVSFPKNAGNHPTETSVFVFPEELTVREASSAEQHKTSRCATCSSGVCELEFNPSLWMQLSANKTYYIEHTNPKVQRT